ncbi:chorismate-binding protein [Tessaracoccus sp. SD287]|uniref:isochorismate synthase n=1 Tax=Tessaracoccus sp. SD287 TaxID=2782008 RepID=UPI001A971070|nr:chorismate-binding protein [Tessaracoccus sp. SD287]
MTRSDRRGRLRARTVAIPDPGPLEAYLPTGAATAFLRRGDGIIGLGEVHRVEVRTASQADAAWSEFIADVEHETELMGHFGTGPLAFGSFLFDPDNSAATSVLVVPELLVGRRKGVSWMTLVGYDTLPDLLPIPQPAPMPHGRVTWREGAMAGEAWSELVATAIRAIDAHEVDKVVLARDVVATAVDPIDPRSLVNYLTAEYPTTWTYLVDGMVGATPEMLVRREGGLATSRVLAGTIRRHGVGPEDAALLADALSSSSKDLREHEFAVTSVAEALEPFCSGMNVPDAPYVLELPNVLHLATDITGVARPGATSLAMAAALHPSAAVCGTPTDVARSLIARIEGMDRERYAGPVGWMDADGNGEWAIALRGGQLNRANPREIRLFAGGGIVADSDPVAELAETRAKLLPMRAAVGD